MKRLAIGLLIGAVTLTCTGCGNTSTQSTTETSVSAVSTTSEAADTSAAVSESVEEEASVSASCETAADSAETSTSSSASETDTDTKTTSETTDKSSTDDAAQAVSAEDAGEAESEEDDHRLLDYAVVYGEYYKALSEGWSGEELIAADISLICADVNDPMNTLGYAFQDLNNDGVDELLIGFVNGSEDYGNVILDMYTLADGVETHVFSSSQRNHYYITALTDYNDYGIYRIGFSGADMYDYEAYLFNGASLECSQAVRYDGTDENTWMMGYEESDGEVVYTDVIDEETGNAIIDSASAGQVQLTFTPFSK